MPASCTAVMCAELATVSNTIIPELCLQKLHLVCTYFMKYIFRETKFSQNCDSDGRHLDISPQAHHGERLQARYTYQKLILLEKTEFV